MNQTEIRKEPRDCFAVLQLFPEPYRQKVRMALESAGGRGVPDRQPLSIGGASHSRQRYTCGLQEIRFRMVRNGGRQFAKDTAAYAALDRQPEGDFADHSAHLPVFHVCV